MKRVAKLGLQTVKAELVAKDFVRILKRWFRQRFPKTWRRQWRTMRIRNAKPEYAGCCASHDFFDANVAMMDALEKHGVHVFGKRGNRPPSARTDCLWNEAWTIAQKEHLTA